MYRLSVDQRFCAAHRIVNYPGNCASMHGHTYSVRAVVASNALDVLGMIIDIRKLKEIIADSVAHFDHKDLNSLPEFQEINPTAENIARILYKQIQIKISKWQNLILESVSVSEGVDNLVTYSE